MGKGWTQAHAITMTKDQVDYKQRYYKRGCFNCEHTYIKSLPNSIHEDWCEIIECETGGNNICSKYKKRFS